MADNSKKPEAKAAVPSAKDGKAPAAGEKAAAEKTPKVRRESFKTTLKDAAANQLIVSGKQEKNGSSWKSSAIYVTKSPETGKKTKTKGVSAVHASREDAQKAHDAIVAKATSDGWSAKAKVTREKKSKVDSFSLDNLPKPAAVVKVAPAAAPVN